jgi:glycogen debranching enzyme
VEAALAWIERFGDIDGDGFVEYRRESADGLVNQGWKDSFDSVFHSDGTLADPPIALCEVQGYVFGAYKEAAEIAEALGLKGRAAELQQRAERLQTQFETDFWSDEINGYVLALDGRKQPCRVRTSNPGHCLMTGIIGERHTRRMAEALFREDMFSGWGIRTASSAERRFNPMSYHNGSVWPHDNAVIAAGLARCGFTDLALRLFTSLFDATMYVDMHRLPELFCGFARRPGEGPTAYPVACKPQAWAAGAIFLLLEAVLGMRIDAQRRQIIFSRPALPRWLQRVRIENLSIGDDYIDLLCERHPHDVGISVMRRRGNISVIHHA